MDVHQASDWVNALSEAESDGGEVSGDVSWVDSASEGSLFHSHLVHVHLFIIIQQWYLSLFLEDQRILIAGKFYPLAVYECMISKRNFGAFTN